MKFLDVHRGTGRLRADALFLILQSDHFDTLQTVIVVPCLPISKAPDLGRLTPIVTILGQDYRANITGIAAISKKLLAEEPIATCIAWRDHLIGALDLIVTGF